MADQGTTIKRGWARANRDDKQNETDARQAAARKASVFKDHSSNTDPNLRKAWSKDKAYAEGLKRAREETVKKVRPHEGAK